MRARAYGPRATIVDGLPSGFPGSVRDAVVADLSTRGLSFDDVVPAASSLVVLHEDDDGETIRGALETLIGRESARRGESDQCDGTLREIRVRYDGVDLGDVALACGLSVDEVVSLHAGSTFTVEFCGFSPGFAYLRGLPERLRLPRRHSPRPRVPARSVAIAAHYSAVYPQDSPGGWHLIGTTDEDMWDVRRDPPAFLRPGDRVRFVRADS